MKEKENLFFSPFASLKTWKENLGGKLGRKFREFATVVDVIVEVGFRRRDDESNDGSKGRGAPEEDFTDCVLLFGFCCSFGLHCV